MQKPTSAWRLWSAVGVCTVACASNPGVDADAPATCPKTTSTATRAVSVATTPAPSRSVDARALAQHSSGEARGKACLLSDNGFVGSYLRLEEPHSVTFRVQASGHAEAGAPRIELEGEGERERAADILEDTMRLVLPSPRTVASSSAATTVTIAWTRATEPALFRSCAVNASTG